METFERAADALGVHLPAAHTILPEAHALPGGPIDVHVVSPRADVDGGQGGLVTRVGAAQIRRAGEHDDGGGGRARSGPQTRSRSGLR